MVEFFKMHQLNIMLFLCGACAVMVVLLAITRFLDKRRKKIMINMEVVAFFLLFFDRLAYTYAADPSRKGYVMVRVSNFFVFFLTSAIVLGFNTYVSELMTRDKPGADKPKLLTVSGALAACGMVMAVVSAFTNLYYYFDETNKYQRGNGFLIAYIIPVLCPLIQFYVIQKNRKTFSKLIYTSLVLYIFVPIVCGIAQIFLYGLSIVNMSMVLVSISLYIFTYLDINNTVEHAHEIEIEHMQGENRRMIKLFDQTAKTIVAAAEKNDEYAKVTAVKTAEYAKRIAKFFEKDDDFCEKVYYVGLLHDVDDDILSYISEYPFLVEGARYSHEKYNGTGYPEGLKGEAIPEMSRIVAVADTFAKMTTKQKTHDAIPDYVAREAFVQGAGEDFDPAFAEIMVKLIDTESEYKEQDVTIETELSCNEYREYVSRGIQAEKEVKKLSFDLVPENRPDDGFSEPALVLFDSYDRRVHNESKTIDDYHYFEYGEIWFNDHMVSSGARKMEMTEISWHEQSGPDADLTEHFEITASRYEDHIMLKMSGPDCTKTVVIALPDGTKSSYIGITGEHCRIFNISTESLGETTQADDIPRIVSGISYIDHMESDIKNVQIDRDRTASTEGIKVDNRLRILFHSMSLPSSSLVWHCPFVALFYSDDGHIGGPNYHEYSLIKLNGEYESTDDYSETRFKMKKTEEFKGWDTWKAANKRGIECEVTFEKRGDRITVRTNNMGISIESVITIKDGHDKVYAALTGDQVALTDIRIR